MRGGVAKCSRCWTLNLEVSVQIAVCCRWIYNTVAPSLTPQSCYFQLLCQKLISFLTVGILTRQFEVQYNEHYRHTDISCEGFVHMISQLNC